MFRTIACGALRVSDKADPIKSPAGENNSGNNNNRTAGYRTRALVFEVGFVIVKVPPRRKVRKTSSESQYSNAGIVSTVW